VKRIDASYYIIREKPLSSGNVKGKPMQNQGVPLYIVDGYNVIFGTKIQAHGGVEDAREKLVRLLGSYCRKKRVEILIVWDGKGGLHPASGSRARGKGGEPVKIVYSGEGQSADEKILRLVERDRTRKRITVVSNDRRHIVGEVKGLGAKTMTVEEFIGLVGVSRGGGVKAGEMVRVGERRHEDARKEKSEADDLTVDDWLNIFNAKKG
jgi:predicted RNA-binding protein with PIN domain